MRLERKEFKEADEAFAGLKADGRNDAYASLGAAAVNFYSIPAERRKVRGFLSSLMHPCA